MTPAQKQERINKLRRIQTEIAKAIKEIEKKEEVKISFGSTQYDLTMFSTKMTVTETAKTVEVKENNVQKNRQLSKMYGFPGNIVGMKYNNGIITGFKTRNRKYPIIFEKYGKSYKTTVGSVKLELKDEDILAYDKMLDRDITLDKVGIK